jgi:hypothetical protein
MSGHDSFCCLKPLAAQWNCWIYLHVKIYQEVRKTVLKTGIQTIYEKCTVCDKGSELLLIVPVNNQNSKCLL